MAQHVDISDTEESLWMKTSVNLQEAYGAEEGFCADCAGAPKEWYMTISALITANAAA